MKGFDEHTAVRRSEDSVWRAEIGEEIRGFSGAHGGYVAALALRAMTATLGAPERPPRSLTIQLLAAIRPDDIELAAVEERAGSSMSATTVRIRQNGETVATAAAAFGQRHESLTMDVVRAPEVPAPEQCQPIIDKPLPNNGASMLVEHRPAAAPLPLSGGAEARITVWMRLVEERPIDAALICMLADGAPPALYGQLDRFIAMPSTEISVHFADLPATAESPWLLGDFRTCFAAHGYASEDGQLWTPGGRLIAQVRQLRRVLDQTPPATNRRS